MSSSPAERPAEIKTTFPNAPPVSEHEAELAANISRREFGGKALRLARNLGVVALIGSIGIEKLDALYTDNRWLPNDPEISLARGANKIARGGPEWLVFGGYGQQDSTNAAHELFTAFNDEYAVSSIKYPSQGFVPSDLSEVILSYVQERKMSKLNIVGASMGLPTGLLSFQAAENSRASQEHMNESARIRILPPISYAVGYSSPSDLYDAYKGELAHLVTEVSDATGYQGDALGKFGYSMIDGLGDPEKAFNIFNKPQWIDHVWNSIQQTANDCPPKMCVSQIKILSNFNIRTDIPNFKDILGHKIQAVYIEPSNSDRTVNDSRARLNYVDAFNEISLKDLVTLSSGDTGHSNTTASAIALAEWLAAEDFTQTSSKN